MVGQQLVRECPDQRLTIQKSICAGMVSWKTYRHVKLSESSRVFVSEGAVRDLRLEPSFKLFRETGFGQSFSCNTSSMLHSIFCHL